MPLSASEAEAAHRHFSCDCFNKAWTYIALPERTPEQTEAMLLSAQASLWHWTQRPDCTNQHRSIGHWQAARVYALAGQGQVALWHAERSLRYSQGLAPFYLGYAHEALARAATVVGSIALAEEHLQHAESYLAQVAEEEERRALEADLRSLRTQMH